ncbi:MAG TPA: phosphatase PAP2 family protein [Baekduia sp.]|uniref:phosphatase PAP2 family protein n=1 Tax=Baekduia sp. TaxID=2600305 RepID=UPI002D795D6D|nr:phosphatase PAP2 family protein [Baekduia sp.]HET6508037.1 phosphatase PAP2 family protein [Baekduia sp.]
MDFTLVKDLNSLLAHHDALEDPLVAYANASEALFLGLLIAAFVLVGGRRGTGTRRAVVAAGLGAGVALALAAVLARVVDRPRPFVAHPGDVHLFAAHAADAGFPSDHATASFAIAVALLLRSRAWGVAALVAATLLSVARVAMGIHYPSDVLAGAALGALVALAFHHPRVRALTDALADRVGALRVWDRSGPRAAYGSR